MVITALTRNQVYQQWYRGFESHPLRQRGIIRASRKAEMFCGFFTKLQEVSKWVGRLAIFTFKKLLK